MGGARTFRLERCPRCGLHLELCVCEHEPRIELGFDLVIVQHNKERNKPTNTGRMVAQAVVGCGLHRYAVRDVAFDESPLQRADRHYRALFPDPEAAKPVVLSPQDLGGAVPGDEPRDVPGDEPPTRLSLVVLDGTWAQCARMRKRIAAIETMPYRALPPGPPPIWGVRKDPDPARVSTIESVIRAITVLEGPQAAAPLVQYFHRVAAAMQFMKGLRPTPEVPAEWSDG